MVSELKPYERCVYYYETDKMGIVHHSNYIRMFEETRVHYLQQFGMTFEEIEAMGLMMPVLSIECSYKSPMVFNEPFESYAVLTKFNGASMNVEYRIISKRTGAICVTGKSSHCFTDKELRPVRIKRSYPELYELFSRYAEYDPFGAEG